MYVVCGGQTGVWRFSLAARTSITAAVCLGLSALYDMTADPYQTNNLISASGAEDAATDDLESDFFDILVAKFPAV